MKMPRLFCCVGFFFAVQAHADIAVPMEQLPYRNPQQLRALLAQDPSAFDWNKVNSTLDKYAPPEIEIIAHPRAWIGPRAECNDLKTKAACEYVMQVMIYAMERKEELGWTKMRIITLEDIPYRDPAPLYPLIDALDYNKTAPDYPTITQQQAIDILEPYLPYTDIVDAPAGSQFNYDRYGCMFPHYSDTLAPFWAYCFNYARELADLMEAQRNKGKIMINPFGS